LDSYPEQLSSCADGTPVKGRGKGFPPDDVGTGAAPSVGGAPTGGYATGGYATAGYGVGGGTPAGGYATGGTGYGSAAINCQSYQRCSINVSCSAGLSCVSIPGCQLAICAPAQALCQNLCAGECDIGESYPQQLECTTNDITGYEGYGTGGTGTGGSGGASSYGGAPYEGGGAPEGGFAGEYAYGGTAP
jgi:hypothetical protein